MRWVSAGAVVLATAAAASLLATPGAGGGATAAPKSKGFWSGAVTVVRATSGPGKDLRDSVTFSLGAGGGKQVDDGDWEQAFSWQAEHQHQTSSGCPGPRCCTSIESGTGEGGPVGGPGRGIWGIVHVVSAWGTLNPTYAYTTESPPVLKVVKTGCGAEPRIEDLRFLGLLGAIAAGCSDRAGACRWADGLRTVTGKRTVVRKFGADTLTETQKTAFTLLEDCDHDGTPDIRDANRCG